MFYLRKHIEYQWYEIPTIAAVVFIWGAMNIVGIIGIFIGDEIW